MSGHLPVMVEETLQYLQPSRGGIFVDCTLGLGGHTRRIFEAGAARVIGLDRDPDALAEARTVLTPWIDRADLVHADYRSIDDVLDRLGVTSIDGALADLGVSSMQFDTPGRGFSFQRDEPLDMRMDRTSGPTAAELVAQTTERELADVIYTFGEERFSRRIARALVQARSVEPITTTGRLATIVRRVLPRRGPMRIDPATRTFQALRIWVNRELEGLETFLGRVIRRLRTGGRLVVITFHSLEDRIVKHTLRGLAQNERLISVLTKKPVIPADAELERNPRARSAKLRAAERLEAAA